MNLYITALLFASILTGCSSRLVGLNQDKYDYSIALNDLRDELADLRHSLNNTQVEIQILDEQLKNQELSLKKAKNLNPSLEQGSKTSGLEKKICSLEQQQSKTSAETKQLLSHANQTSECLGEYSKKISELEYALQNQKKLVSYSTVKTGETKNSYIVKPGDSLEKISKLYKISISSLKEANNLSQNKIIIGQELKIPSSD